MTRMIPRTQRSARLLPDEESWDEGTLFDSLSEWSEEHGVDRDETIVEGIVTGRVRALDARRL